MKRVYLRRQLLLGLGALALVVVLVLLLVQPWRPRATGSIAPPTQHCVAEVGGQTAELNPDQAYWAAIIAGVAVQRGLPPRAVTIALATALQESDLRNLDYGDRDSVGLFQQRPSQGWGTVEQIMNPQYAAGKFYDALVKVPNWRTGDVNDVAQAVQRSGVPDGYRKHVERAKLLASALSGETAAAFTCMSTVGAADPAGFAALLKATYGGVAPGTVVQEAPVRVDVTAASDATTWSVAAASQAWAAKFGVNEVRTGEKVWRSSAVELPAWSSTTPAAAARVVSVVFG